MYYNNVPLTNRQLKDLGITDEREIELEEFPKANHYHARNSVGITLRLLASLY